MIGVLALLVCIAGALAYALSVNPKLQEMGRLAFAVGLLAFLLGSAASLLALLHR